MALASSPTREAVFLSYDRERHTKEFASSLKRELEHSGFSVWLDLPETDDISSSISRQPSKDTKNQRALERCKGLVALLTKKYVSSQFCKEELYMASSKRKRIFPVVYEDGWNDGDVESSEGSKVFYTLNAVQLGWYMFRPDKDDYGESVRVLVESMKISLSLPLPGDRPTLRLLQLMKGPDGNGIRIIESVASKWKSVAIALGFGGPTIKTIEQGSHYQPEESCREVFIKWLDGRENCTAITWSSLGDCLKDAGLSSVATSLECLISCEQSAGHPTEETDNPSIYTLSAVSEQIKRFETRFENLVISVSTELEEKRTNLKKFRHSLTLSLPQEIKPEHYKFLMESLAYMVKVESLEEIFLYFNLYWNFIDYSLLKYIIHRFGSQQLVEKMTEYVSDLSKFRQRTTLNQMNQCWPSGECDAPPPREFSKLMSRLDRDASEYTLEELENLRQKFCREFSLSRCFMMLRYSQEGSVIVYWLVPSVLAGGLMAAIRFTAGSMFFEENNIVELTIDGEILVSRYRMSSPKYIKQESEEVLTGMSVEQIQDQIESKLEKRFTLASIVETCEWVLHVRTLNGKIINVKCNENDTVADVKAVIKVEEGIPIHNQQLAKRETKLPDSHHPDDPLEARPQLMNVVLEDHAPLSSYGIHDGHELILQQVDSANPRSYSITDIAYVYVKTESGRIFTVPVEKSTSIDALKERIQQIAKESNRTKELGIPAEPNVAALRLIYRGEELKGWQTMQQCGIENGSTIRLISVKLRNRIIFIQTLSGQKFDLECDLSDTVSVLKTKIESAEATPPDDQNLVFLGRVLEDDAKTLSECKINLGDTLHLTYKRREESTQPLSLPTADSEPIFVKTLTGRTFHLDDCSVTDTIGTLKAKIQVEESIPPDQQQLVVDGQVLRDDSKTLAHYNVSLGDTINLSYRRGGGTRHTHTLKAKLTKVHVKGSYGQPIEVDVENSNTIAEVKMKVYHIQEEMGVPEKQELYFVGKKLDNETILGECGIRNGDTLHLRFGKGVLEEITVKSFTTDIDDISLSVKSSDTIADIKSKICDKKPEISPDLQRMIYAGSARADSCTLSELKLPNHGILYLAIVVRDTPKITMKRLTGSDITLDFNPESTVADLKAQIQEKEEIPTNRQALVFNGQFLRDEKTLGECGISNASNLYMYDDGKPESLLWVKIPSMEKTVTLDYDPEATVRNLKDELFKKERMVSKYHILLFNGVQLDDELAISSYGIQKEGVLDLLILDKQQFCSGLDPIIEETD